jgi:sugar/nucleoside kinase (ribokinase family)
MEGRVNHPMILVVGNINYDILFPLDRLPGPHEKLTCDEARTSFGGSAANTAWWLANLREEVALAGAAGGDLLGTAHLEHLRKAGVNTQGVNRVNGTTGIAVIFSMGREKRMIRAPGANLSGKVDPELLDQCDRIYLSGGDTQALAGYAALAKEKNIPVYCGWHGAMESEVAAFVDGFILNSDEVRMVTGLEGPVDGIRALDSRIAAVTLPTGGCLVSEGIDVLKVPAPELDPVDRTGGGDAFAAGFLAGLGRGLCVEECGRWGNALAAAVIMEMGARPDILIPEI